MSQQDELAPNEVGFWLESEPDAVLSAVMQRIESKLKMLRFCLDILNKVPDMTILTAQIDDKAHSEQILKDALHWAEEIQTVQNDVKKYFERKLSKGEQ